MCKKEHVIFVGLLILSAVSFGLFLSSAPRPELSQKIEQKVLNANITATPTPTPRRFAAATTRPTATLQPPTPTSGDTHVAVQEPTPTLIQQASTETITLQVIQPSGNFTFTLSYRSGSNSCSILNDAKSEGKISSVTITHYGPPLNSDYVKEINGYSDNWNFAINGETKPTGCSNYTLSNGDSVSWKYN